MALLHKTLGITLAVAGVLNPMVAAARMVLSSRSAIADSPRLTRF